MFNSSKLVSIVFLFSILMGTKYNYAQVTDSLFVYWNKATISSLERQIKSITDSSQRSRYENRLSAITGYWDIENVASINAKSIRYTFLEKLLQQYKNVRSSKFYIIEANESGSKVLLRNFVICLDSVNNAHVEFFTNVNQIWQKRGESKISNFFIENELKSYITQLWKGFNNDDIIVTEFANGKIKESEYYLYSTLSAKSRIKDILNSYRKENFTK